MCLCSPPHWQALRALTQLAKLSLLLKDQCGLPTELASLFGLQSISIYACAKQPLSLAQLDGAMPHPAP